MKMKKVRRSTVEAIVFLTLLILVFSLLGSRMGGGNMLKTLMNTAHDLLLNTVFYLMGITVLTGALSKLLSEFGVVTLLERFLRPLMKPLYRLPGVAALGAVMTFLSDNPAIIALSKDKTFSAYFKKYQLISLTNFGTAFGMGFVVMIRTPGIIWRPSSTPFLPPSRMAFRKRMKTPSFLISSTCSSWMTSGVPSWTGLSRSGQALRQLRCITRVEMTDPQAAPKKPISAAAICP